MSSGDNDRTGTGTPLYQNLQATISEVCTRRTERSINELHSPLDERVCSEQQPHLNELPAHYRGEHPVDISAIHTSFVPDKPSRWGSRIEKIETTNSKSKITPEMLAEEFNIGLKSATNTLKVTTQKGIRTASTVAKRFQTQSWRNKRTLSGKWFSDTMHFAETDITRGDSCAQVTTNGKGFSHFYPLMGKGDAWQGHVS